MGVTTSVTFLTLAMMGSSVASAATPTRPATHMLAARTHKATPKTPAAPAGCNNGNLCVYNAGNGGNLCFQTNRSLANWPTACNRTNEGEFNRNGNAVQLCEGSGCLGCEYLLFSGHFLLFNAKDFFQGPGDFCTDMTLEKKLGSNRFV
jgi:hypothetical protein